MELDALAGRLADATRAAARALSPLVGRGTPDAIDAAAVAALRASLADLPVAAIVVATEGAKDRAPMLAIGERLGAATAAIGLDLAVDPVDGTRAVANRRAGAVIAIAAAARGALFAPGALPYLDKIAVGPAAASVIDLDAPLVENLRRVAAALGRPIHELGVSVLDRPRNQPHRDAVRAAGARLIAVADADLAQAVAVGLGDRGIDVAIGISGAPETVLAACALRCLGGQVLARAAPGAPILDAAALAAGERIAFAATGVTASALLDAIGDDGDAHTLILARGAPPRERRGC